MRNSFDILGLYAFYSNLEDIIFYINYINLEDIIFRAFVNHPVKSVQEVKRVDGSRVHKQELWEEKK